MAGLLRHVAAALLCLVAAAYPAGASTYYASDPNLGSARVVFQTNHGDIEFGFFPHVAPKTVEHIFKLVRLGGYNTNHFFRIDKGFVAQVADVAGGRKAPMNEEQKRQAEKSIVGEFSTVKHVRGILSMGRYSDPDSASSSFSILLGDAPHLDGQYAVFGRVTKGDDTLRKLERLPTHKEGIFVMPLERIEILSTYYYGLYGARALFGLFGIATGYSVDIAFPNQSIQQNLNIEVESCEVEKSVLKRRLSESASEVERWRRKCFI